MNERPWVGAAIGSLVFHGALVIVASLLPDGARPGGAQERDELFTPGAVIPLEAPVTPLAALTVDEPADLPELPLDPELPARAPEDAPASSEPMPELGTQPPPEPSQASQAESQAPGLAFAGLRDQATASATAGAMASVNPADLGGSRVIYEEGVTNVGVGGGAVQGPSTPKKSGGDYSFAREGDKRIYRDPHGRFVATLRSDGRVDFRNKGAKASWKQIALSDPGVLLSKMGGEDPYARLKARLLRATFDMRLGMAMDFQVRQLDKRVARLERDLNKLWVDERRELPAKRELLFQRWDECDEPEEAATAKVPGFGDADTSKLDDARQEAAGKARKTIVRFIRKHAPKGTPLAYTASELVKMNGRRVSKEPFSPYKN